jgi:hypothetical protein
MILIAKHLSFFMSKFKDLFQKMSVFVDTFGLIGRFKDSSCFWNMTLPGNREKVRVLE